MNHAPVLPIVIPALAAALMLLDRRVAVQRALAWGSLLLLVLAAGWLLAATSHGWRGIYLVGNWAAPWGVVLVADRLSALMVAVTTLLAGLALAASRTGWDTRGQHFHPLLQIQLMGLNGAFLTGDLFNLFVFFEVLLIASYGLLVHGDGRERMVAGLRFVTLNLLGSSLFLVAAAILYGVTGTLNLADLSLRLASGDVAASALARAGAWLLLVVFCLKAAILPLSAWLPGTYGAASAPVLVLFAVMTKVGLYAILRVFTLSFGSESGPLAGAAFPWIAAFGAASFAAATTCALAGVDLRRLTSMLVIASAGLLLIGIGLATPATVAAALYYLVHTTFSAAAMFLVVDLVSRARGPALDRLDAAGSARQPALVGGLFMLAAAAMAGLPPFGGFIGKAMLLQATLPAAGAAAGATGWIWATVFAGSLFGLVALSRAGSTLFWKADGDFAAAEAGPAATHGDEPAIAAGSSGAPLQARDWAPVVAVLGLVAAVSVGAAPLQRYVQAAAEDLLQPAALIDATLRTRPMPGPHTPAPETRR